MIIVFQKHGVHTGFFKHIFLEKVDDVFFFQRDKVFVRAVIVKRDAFGKPAFLQDFESVLNVFGVDKTRNVQLTHKPVFKRFYTRVDVQQIIRHFRHP